MCNCNNNNQFFLSGRNRHFQGNGAVTILKVPVHVEHDYGSDYYNHCCGHRPPRPQHCHGSHGVKSESCNSSSSTKKETKTSSSYADDNKFKVDLACGAIVSSGIAIADIIRSIAGVAKDSDDKVKDQVSSKETTSKEAVVSTGEDFATKDDIDALRKELSDLKELYKASQGVKNDAGSANTEKATNSANATETVTTTNTTDTNLANIANSNVVEDSTNTKTKTENTADTKGSSSSVTDVVKELRVSAEKVDKADSVKADVANENDIEKLKKIAKDNDKVYNSVPMGKREVKNQVVDINKFNDWAQAVVNPENKATKAQVKECIKSMEFIIKENGKTEPSANDANFKATIAQTKSLLAKLKAML